MAAVNRLRLREKRFAGAGDAVLSRVDLRLDEGEFVALLGPSGAGKTTLLRILAGLDTDFDGDLEVDPLTLRRGYLFQEARLMPWLTGLQNVALVVAGDEERAAQALDAVDLRAAADLYPRQLSGGMQRRVALARAIAAEPRLLLLDEPFVSLDEPGARQLRSLVVRYWETHGPTIVLVSHNLDEAIGLADRLLFLGGSPATLCHEERPALTREERGAEAGVLTVRQSLLTRHPGLLSGELGDAF